jgi:predicted RNA-binding protein YlxR (DUF448 family)
MIIRMCVVCRERLLQKDMLRFQCKNREVIPFLGIGRSFYICKSCINSKKLDKIIQKICRIDKTSVKNIVTTIKEM